MTVPTWWYGFAEEARRRLRKGAEDYGDRSFAMDLGSLNSEILNELVDVPGWCFVLWIKLRGGPDAFPDREAVQRQFFEAVRQRIVNRDTNSRPAESLADCLAEVERVAAIGACAWNVIGQRLSALRMAVLEQMPYLGPPRIVEDVRAAKRGGVAE